MSNNETSDYGGSEGGGVYMNGGQLYLNGATLEANKAYDGGGVRLYSANLFMDGATMQDNVGYHAGGGIYVNGSVSNRASGLEITGSRFEGNKTGSSGSTRRGGAISYSAASGVGQVNLTIDDTVFHDNESTYGGALDVHVWSTGSVLALTGCTFTENKAMVGGAAWLEGSQTYATYYLTAEVEDCLFEENVATDAGGALYLAAMKDTYIRDDVRFVRNEAAAEGGAIFADENGDTTIQGEGIEFNGNTANRGGAVYYAYTEGNAITAAAQDEIVFRGNQSTGHGGAVFVGTNSVLHADGALFENNEAGGNGGGIYTSSYANLTTYSLSFQGNRSIAPRYFDVGGTHETTYANNIRDTKSLSGPFDLNSSDGRVNKAYNNYDINYTAGALYEYNITYHRNDGGGDTAGHLVEHGDDYSIVGHTDLSWQGQRSFLGWSLTPGGPVSPAHASGTQLTGVTSHLVLYAVWDTAATTPGTTPPGAPGGTAAGAVVPTTGDNAPLVPLMVAAVLGLLGTVVLVALKKRRAD